MVESGEPLEERLCERARRDRRFSLGEATRDEAYFTKANNLFLWERATLFDPATGQVYDNINISGRVARFSLTYNQGTFVGAANLLGYTNEARLAATYTMNQLCKDGYLPASERRATAVGSTELLRGGFRASQKIAARRRHSSRGCRKTPRRRGRPAGHRTIFPGAVGRSRRRWMKIFVGLQQRSSNHAGGSSARRSQTGKLQIKGSAIQHSRQAPLFCLIASDIGVRGLACSEPFPSS